MSASSLIAGMLRNSAQDMKRAYDKMPEDRKAWHPTVDGNTGRDAKDQVIECALINGWVAGVLNVGGIPDFAFSEDTNAKYEAGKKALGASGGEVDTLISSTETLASAVEGLSDETLDTIVKHPFYDKNSSVAEIILLCHWNTVYHIGQLNYIQVLYGDNS